MTVETDPNPMPPDFNLFPRCRAVFHFIFDQLQSPGLSDHDRHNTGGGPALDRALYEQGDLFERVERWERGTLPE